MLSRNTVMQQSGTNRDVHGGSTSWQQRHHDLVGSDGQIGISSSGPAIGGAGANGTDGATGIAGGPGGNGGNATDDGAEPLLCEN
jgi:hypothetical protein